MNATELKVARTNTRAFIDADPIQVVLRRPSKALTTAGGHKAGPSLSLQAQTVRLVPLSGNVWDRSKVNTDEGNLPDVTFQLVGMPTLDIAKNDTFVNGDDEWLVSHVSPERTVRVSANLSLRSQVA